MIQLISKFYSKIRAARAARIMEDNREQLDKAEEIIVDWRLQQLPTRYKKKLGIEDKEVWEEDVIRAVEVKRNVYKKIDLLPIYDWMDE